MKNFVFIKLQKEKPLKNLDFFFDKYCVCVCGEFENGFWCIIKIVF